MSDRLGPPVHTLSPGERAVAGRLHEGLNPYEGVDPRGLVSAILWDLHGRGLAAMWDAGPERGFVWGLSPSGLNAYCDGSCPSPNCPRRKTR